MNEVHDKQIALLRARGVEMACPGSLEIGPEVDPERIAPGVILHSGCRLFGARTSIGPGCEIGRETPATIENCCLGRNVRLQGGFLSGAVFLDGSSMGSGAHVRAGTLLEEQASGAHSVGFKQTILLPFVTAGSLINFCDILMAGGTDRQHHSEVGSSYIHFNFTPRGDKATASLVGDVPRGVMLDQRPVFLGGQGGLVGPVRIEYGCIIPAGTIYRKDALGPDRLLLSKPVAGLPRPYDVRVCRSVGRVVHNSLRYIGNLRALQQWYHCMRRPWMQDDAYLRACLEASLDLLAEAAGERIRRLGQLAELLPPSIELLGPDTHPERSLQQEFHAAWPEVRAGLQALGSESLPPPENLSRAWADVSAEDYLAAVRQLNPQVRRTGTAWLHDIVGQHTALFKTG